MTGFPWATGDELLAADLNAAIAAASSAVAVGGPFLPLSGGTVSRHMTSAAYDANLTVNATALGSGVNGPTTAQTALTLNLFKDNWNIVGSGATGEIDGLAITCRQGGTGDCGGILVGALNTYGAGYIAGHEYAIGSIDVATGRYHYLIDTQEAGIDTIGNQCFAHSYNLNVGTFQGGILVQSNATSGYSCYFNNFITFQQNGIQVFNVDGSGNLLTSGSLTAGSGVATVGDGALAAGPVLYVQSQPGHNRLIGFLSGAGGASGRWYIGANGVAEPGSGNVGTDFQFSRYSDIGGLLDNPLVITRSTGSVTLHNGLGVWNATPPVAKPTVSGAKGGNAALASLLTALASYGLVTDSTT